VLTESVFGGNAVPGITPSCTAFRHLSSKLDAVEAAVVAAGDAAGLGVGEAEAFCAKGDGDACGFASFASAGFSPAGSVPLCSREGDAAGAGAAAIVCVCQKPLTMS